MVAVSQAPSPESNPNPPLPVKAMVVQYTTIKLMGQKLEWFVAGQARAIRSVTMSHHNRRESYWLLSNKYGPSEKSGTTACISSRITTVIHVIVDYQINYNCFNEPFAVSLYIIYT